MQYLRIFILQSEHVLQNRARVFVWFLNGMIPPIIFLLFWQGVSQGRIGQTGWTPTEVLSYYFLFIVFAPLLTSHIEEDVSKRDIYEGELANYLTRPLAYFSRKLLEEIPYRLLEGLFGFVIFLGGMFLFSKQFVFTTDISILAVSSIVAIFGFFLSFLLKMIVGLFGFWVMDIGGYYQILQIVLLIFAGYVVPLDFLPKILDSIALALPFAYMMYYPVIAFLGKLSFPELLSVLGMQIVWLVVLGLVYKTTLRAGLRQFAGIG